MIFVKTIDRVEVPLARIRAVRREPFGSVALELDTGELKRTTREDWAQASRTSERQLLPAFPNTYLLHYARYHHNLVIWREPVIGWSVTAWGFAEAVTFNGIDQSTNDAPIILHPDGRVQEVEQIFETYDAWLKDLQEDGRPRSVARPELKLVE